jgi:hypothetical protein
VLSVDSGCYVKVKQPGPSPYVVLFFDLKRNLLLFVARLKGRHTDLKCVAHWGETTCPGISV